MPEVPICRVIRPTALRSPWRLAMAYSRPSSVISGLAGALVFLRLKRPMSVLPFGVEQRAQDDGADGDRGGGDGDGEEHGDQDRADDQDDGGAAADEGERGTGRELDRGPGRDRGDRGRRRGRSAGGGVGVPGVMVVGWMTVGGVTRPVGWGMVGGLGRSTGGSPFTGYLTAVSMTGASRLSARR
ncbi:hypothetical protein GCM10027073_70240 [Streptomyces chlorus]